MLKQEGSTDKDRKKIDKVSTEILSKAHSAVIIGFGDQVLREVLEEATAIGI